MYNGRLELLLTGLFSLLAQTLLLREVGVTLYGLELAYILGLGVWLTGGALGALPARRHPLPRWLTVDRLLAAGTLLAFICLVFARTGHLFFSGITGAYLPLSRQFFLLVLVLFPAGAISGLLFRIAATGAQNLGKSLPWAYGVESFGGVIGGLLATFLAHLGLRTLPAVALLGLILAFFYLFRDLIGRTRSRQHPGEGFQFRSVYITGILSLAILPFSNHFDLALTAKVHPDMVASLETPYCRATFTSDQGLVTVFENNVLTYESYSTRAELLVHSALLLHPSPGKVLVAGGGLWGDLREVEKHRPEIIDYVELDKKLYQTTVAILDTIVAPSVAENVTVYFDDPRHFLRNSERYDVILVDLPAPESCQSNRYYTREFFSLCREHLAENGLLAFSLRSSENYWPPPLARRMSSIYKALHEVFPEVAVLPGSDNIYLAGFDTFDPDRSIERFHTRSLQTRFVSPALLHYRWTNDRFDQAGEILQRTPASPNSDALPHAMRYSLVSLLSKFHPGIAYLPLLLHDPGAAWKIKFGIALLLVLFIVLSVGRKRSFGWLVLSFMAGFIGMTLETVLLLYYQVKQGVLYQDIGSILMIFMLGLALGALLNGRVVTRKKGEMENRTIRRITVTVNIIAVAGVHIMVISHQVPSLLLILLLNGIAGCATALLFSLAAIHYGKGRGNQTTGILYFSDLAGGVSATLLGGMIMVPFLGLIGLSMLALFSVAAATILCLL